jgi:TonB family protein
MGRTVTVPAAGWATGRVAGWGRGTGNGGGFGPGAGGGVGGGVFRVGGGVSAPAVIFKIDPEYSEEARKAKYSGTVLLSVIVDAEGRARDVHVVKSLGMGLDEKAVEAVLNWKFKPGMRGGVAVNVRAQIEVNFRLL